MSVWLVHGGSMRKLIIFLLFSVVFIFSDQIAISDNGIKIRLKDDSTWTVVDDDWMEIEITPLAYTQDSQRIFLDDKQFRWYYISNQDSLLEALFPGQELTSENLPYYTMKKPKLLDRPKTEYPAEAKNAGIEGRTVVKVLVDTDGKITDAEILISSGNELLDAAAIKAAMKMRFTPAEQFGRKVRVWLSVPFQFKL